MQDSSSLPTSTIHCTAERWAPDRSRAPPRLRTLPDLLAPVCPRPLSTMHLAKHIRIPGVHTWSNVNLTMSKCNTDANRRQCSTHSYQNYPLMKERKSIWNKLEKRRTTLNAARRMHNACACLQWTTSALATATASE